MDLYFQSRLQTEVGFWQSHQNAAVSALGSCHQNFFESSTDQAGEPKTAMEVLEVRIPEAEAVHEDI